MASPATSKKTTTPAAPVIMQIIPALGAGGAEQGCIDIAAELTRAGAQAIVVSNGGSRIHELARAGALHINMPVHSKNPLVMFRNIYRLRKLIRKHKVDIVHARSRAPAWSALQAVRGTTARFMTTCHAPYNISGKAKNFYNSSIARGDRVIAISGHVANYLLENYKIDPRNIRLIHRGVALEKFHPTAVTPERMIRLAREWRIPDGTNVVLLPGRLTRWKGHHVLIDAMAKLGRPDVFAIMIGDDQGRTEYRAELEQAIRDKHLEGKMRIIEHCNDMPAAYMLANVVVSASTDPEGFGRVPIEGQAMGRPVIATDHGGAQETIVRGETGWLIPPGDADALCRAIKEALTLEPMQRSILATRAMAHIAQHFTREKMADETLNVYAELLEEKITPARTDGLRRGHPPTAPLGSQQSAHPQKMAAQ
ncbi:MAG: glycosyltransferase family 4 protein [Alphaproteobacteria bacterium]|nr:glycosyltransferase family 4 protein [Alphaproteobacteria bacterium]MBU0858553.1 glycosyltransferase family 4 protein [Alphaproteobacteria bacterium]